MIGVAPDNESFNRAYWMEKRRLLYDELAVIEKGLSITSQTDRLKGRIRELEDRLGIKPGE